MLHFFGEFLVAVTGEIRNWLLVLGLCLKLCRNCIIWTYSGKVYSSNFAGIV